MVPVTQQDNHFCFISDAAQTVTSITSDKDQHQVFFYTLPR